MADETTLRDRVLARRDDHARAAWASLGGYKFWMFGYHAAGFVQLNQLVDKADRLGNPFRVLVHAARRFQVLVAEVQTEERKVETRIAWIMLIGREPMSMDEVSGQPSRWSVAHREAATGGTVCGRPIPRIDDTWEIARDPGEIPAFVKDCKRCNSSADSRRDHRGD